MDQAGFWHREYPKLCCKGIWVSPRIRVFPSGTFPKLQTADFLLFRHGTSTAASVVNLVGPSPVYHTERRAHLCLDLHLDKYVSVLRMIYSVIDVVMAISNGNLQV